MATLRADQQRLLEEILKKNGSLSMELLEKIAHNRFMTRSWMSCVTCSWTSLRSRV